MVYDFDKIRYKMENIYNNNNNNNNNKLMGYT